MAACNKPLAFELQKVDCAHPYLRGRGISEETARKFGVGVFLGKGSMHGRCVIPIHNGKGELVGDAGRAIDGSEPRYKFPVNFHKSLELYNLHRINPIVETLCIVEGFFDCMRVCEAGFPCVALMGSSLSDAQEEVLVRDFKGACLLFDGDEAGRTAAADCLTRLGPNMWVRAHVLPEGKQPDMLTGEEVQALLEG